MNLALEPLVIRRTGFSPVFRYSCLHSHSHTIHNRSHNCFTSCGTLPYHTHPLHMHNMRGSLMDIRGFGGVLKPRYIVGAEPLDQ